MRTKYRWVAFGISFGISAGAAIVVKAAAKVVTVTGFDSARVFVQAGNGKKVILKRSDLPDVSRVTAGQKISIGPQSKAWGSIPE